MDENITLGEVMRRLYITLNIRPMSTDELLQESKYLMGLADDSYTPMAIFLAAYKLGEAKKIGCEKGLWRVL